MKNTFGNSVAVTLFGESHGKYIGAVIDGLSCGIKVDEDFIAARLSKRYSEPVASSKRRETDKFEIVSGVLNGYTTGAPICIIIPNNDVRHEDYIDFAGVARPSHSDYCAYEKYCGFADLSGGGHFSGRLTAAITAAAAIVIPPLYEKGIKIGTHILRLGNIADRGFEDTEKDIDFLSGKSFAVLDGEAELKMKNEIADVSAAGDSIGAVLETAVIGIEAGVGEPFFDTAEGVLSHALFSIPAIKGVEFGAGFSLCEKRGSEANDELYAENGKVFTATNNNGGINGGITNGMPLVFRCAVKPTPSISLAQKTVRLSDKTNTEIKINGRHDPCIAPKACVAVESITALALCDMLAVRHGTGWIAGK